MRCSFRQHGFICGTRRIARQASVSCGNPGGRPCRPRRSCLPRRSTPAQFSGGAARAPSSVARSVAGVLAEARVLAQVAECGFDVVGYRPQRLQVRQGVGGAAAIGLGARLQLRHVRLHARPSRPRGNGPARSSSPRSCAAPSPRAMAPIDQSEQEHEQVAARGGGLAGFGAVASGGIDMAGSSWLRATIACRAPPVNCAHGCIAGRNVFPASTGCMGAARWRASRPARVAVVGLGGVGSWAVEALARSGVGALTLIDADDLCVSNTNRQLPALEGQYGRGKAEAMAERCRAINPQIDVDAVASFLTPAQHGGAAGSSASTSCSTPATASAARSRRSRGAGAASSRSSPWARPAVASTRPWCACATCRRTEHDAMLALIRRKLRGEFNFPKGPKRYFGVPAIYSLENVRYPQADGSVCGLRPQLGADAALKLDCGARARRGDAYHRRRSPSRRCRRAARAAARIEGHCRAAAAASSRSSWERRKSRALQGSRLPGCGMSPLPRGSHRLAAEATPTTACRQSEQAPALAVVAAASSSAAIPRSPAIASHIDAGPPARCAGRGCALSGWSGASVSSSRNSIGIVAASRRRRLARS